MLHNGEIIGLMTGYDSAIGGVKPCVISSPAIFDAASGFYPPTLVSVSAHHIYSNRSVNPNRTKIVRSQKIVFNHYLQALPKPHILSELSGIYYS